MKFNNNIKKSTYKNSNIISKEQNKSKTNKNIKTPQKVGGEWIKEAKLKYQQEKNNNKGNISKVDSKKSNNNKKPNEKIINFDDIPVGGGMGGSANFNIEIKVPAKKNPYIDNKINNNNFDNSGLEKDIYSKKKIDDKKYILKICINKNYFNSYLIHILVLHHSFF